MHILHVTHRYWPVIGGSEQYVQAIAERQAAEGHQVTVVATDAYDLAYLWDRDRKHLKEREEVVNGVRVARVPVRHLPGTVYTFAALRLLAVLGSGLPGGAIVAGWLGRWTPYLPSLAATMAALGREWDTVFAWNATFDRLMTAAWDTAQKSHARAIAIPFLHLGGHEDPLVNRTYTMPHQLQLLQAADAILVQTAIEQGYLAGQGIPADHIAIIGAGIDPEKLAGGNGEAFRRRYAVQEPVITFIGPQSADKGTIHLVQAAEQLWQAGQRFVLALAGPMMDDFRRYWDKLPAESRARCLCLGTISEIEKRDLLAATYLLALPSRTESFGIVFLESWFYGRPVIGADAGAIPAVVTQGEDGLLVPYGDVAALAGAITELMVHPARAAGMGERGRQKALSQYTWDSVYERFMAAIGA